MNKEVLVTTIVTYTELLHQSTTPCVATWTPFFITQCTDWCLFLETELSLLSNEDCEQVRELAIEKTKIKVPTISQLLDSLHVLFYTMIQNVFLSNSLYLHVMKNYRFLTILEKDILLKDLSIISSNAATENILCDILQELN